MLDVSVPGEVLLVNMRICYTSCSYFLSYFIILVDHFIFPHACRGILCMSLHILILVIKACVWLYIDFRDYILTRIKAWTHSKKSMPNRVQSWTHPLNFYNKIFRNMQLCINFYLVTSFE